LNEYKKKCKYYTNKVLKLHLQKKGAEAPF
jgi:hypothetical protein